MLMFLAYSIINRVISLWETIFGLVYPSHINPIPGSLSAFFLFRRVPALAYARLLAENAR